MKTTPTSDNHSIRHWAEFSQRQWFINALHAVALSIFANCAVAECEQGVGRLESSEGAVSIEQGGNWQPLTIGACVPTGVRVQVTGGRAVFRLANETLLRASGTTLLRFSAPEEKNWIRLFDGVLHFITRTPHAFDVQTDYVNAGVKGTEFILAANRAQQFGEVIMLEGDVLASNEHGEQHVRGGEAVIARSGQAPSTLTIPAVRDAVQWTLYYPPLPSTTSARLQPALEFLNRSDAAGAIAQLEKIPSSDCDADYYALSAAINLHRGEVTQARADIDRALALQPNHPQALALNAIAAMAMGNTQEAAALLDRAQAPRDTSVLIARSYLEQAQFKLDAALISAQQAAAIDPNAALIQARVAELALMNGDTKQANIAADKAIALQPNFARAHAISGFIHLQQLKFNAAETEFKRAAELDAADPLPRLGLGLIDIRHNHVAAGREQLAVAVALDPGQSLLRSYLGKAYQEEGREKLANDQYALAKTFDNSDPTPWYYSALLARLQNRPFDALDDLNRSIELNDNRAVYRSRLQLDTDEAARTASQAEIYNQLGFNMLARRTAAQAVSTAPSEYGGHRMLAEAYADDPQYDAARASEVLQAELLQPLSATPLLPLLGETNLLATEGAGPSALGFREYNAMFVREKPWLSVSGLGGSNGTGADEVTLSGIYDRFSYALAQYHYETQGHRDNNDARYDVLSAYTKFQANEDLSFLLQVNQRKENRGNLNESFVQLSPQNVDGRVNSILLGSHITLSPAVEILTAFNYQESDYSQIETDNFDPLFLDINLASRVYTSNAEIQGQIRQSFGHMIIGGDWARIKNNVITDQTAYIPDIFSEMLPTSKDEGADRYQAEYFYWTITPTNQMELTAGVSYAETNESLSSEKTSGWYPKISAAYWIQPQLEIRAAYFQSLKRPLTIEQTLEPTQLSGFNQLADEATGIESSEYAFGLDLDLASNQKIGSEISLKKSEIPQTDQAGELSRDEAEQRQMQLYWNLSNDPWALSVSYRYEKIKYLDSISDIRIPTPLTTQSLPLQLQWISRNGFKISATTTYFRQSAEFDSGLTKGHANFTLLDASASYLLPGKHVEIGLLCKNIFDRKFNYQNTSPYDPTPRLSPYDSKRTILAVLKFSY